MKKSVYTILFLFFISGTQAQNFVPNPGFEVYEECPEYYTPRDNSHELIPDWKYPTRATPDYFNRCSNGDLVDVPNNFAGSAEPKAGDGYMGLIAIGSDINYREYIQAQLIQPLEKDVKYCVSFHYRLATGSKFAVDRLGLYFSEGDITRDPIKSNIEANIGVMPQVHNEPGKIMDNKNEWKEICGIYTAKGDERFVVIGNFRLYRDTRVVDDPNVESNDLDKEYSYYYIDEVSVIPLYGNCEACSCAPHDLQATPEKKHRSITLNVTGGKPPYSYQWSNGKSTQTIKNLPTGKYEYTVVDAWGCMKTGEIDFIAPKLTLKVTHEASFTGGDDGWIKLYPTGGKPPYSYTWSNDSTTQNITNLTEGEYIYTVTDSNGDQITNKVVFKDEFKEQLENIDEGGKITLENIFFDYNKTSLKSKSYIELDKLYEFMQENDIKEVEIAGHTDSDGTDAYNLKLSDGRAKAVMDYLVSKGIEKERLTSEGYGETMPIATNSIKDGRAMNRRVEFIIIRK